MKWLAILALAVVAACATYNVPKQPWTDATGALYNHTQRIRCSAVAVAPRLIATASHCVGTDQTPDLEFRGKPARVLVTGSDQDAGGDLGISEGGSDWALVEVADVTPYLPLALEKHQRVLPSLAGGYGRDAHALGAVSCAPRFVAKPEVMIVQCSIVYGDSGGPVVVFDPDPKLLGIVVAFRDDWTMVAPSANFAPYIQ